MNATLGLSEAQAKQICHSDLRCRVIRILNEQRQMDLRALADEVAYRELGETPTDEQREEFQDDLRTIYVEMLFAHNVVEREGRIIRATDQTDTLARAVEPREQSTKWGGRDA